MEESTGKSEAARASCVFLLGFIPDPRLEYRMEAASNIADVTAICWDRGATMIPKPEDIDRWHLRTFRHNHTKGTGRLIPFLKFSVDAFRELRLLNPDAIHVQGIDVALIALAYRLTARLLPRRKVPVLVLEIADIHPFLFSHQPSKLRQIARGLLNVIEAVEVKTADLLVLTSWRHWEARYQAWATKDKTLVLLNVAGARTLGALQPRPPSTPLTVGYFGVLRQKDQLRMLIEVAQSVGIHVCFAGIEIDPQELEEEYVDARHVKWEGSFRKEDLVRLYDGIDLVYSMYDADRENIRYALGNKMFEGIASARPVLVPKGTYMAEYVEKLGVGVAVDHRSRTNLEAVLGELSAHPERIEQMQQACMRVREDILADSSDALYLQRLAALVEA